MWNWLKRLFVRHHLPDTRDVEQVPPGQHPDVIIAPPLKRMPSQDKYQHLDPGHIVPRIPLQMALEYFDQNLNNFPNKNYITIVDYSLHCSKLRFFMIDMFTGAVERHAVAHGKNSDPDNDGYCTSFSNVSGSQQSSLGFVKTGETYSGTHPYELKLDGLSSTNSNLRIRSVIIHPCDYVHDGASHNGRSWGCLALSESVHKGVIDKLRNGSLILCWHPDFLKK